MTKTKEQTDCVQVGMTPDKTRVRLRFKNIFGDTTEVNIEREAAIYLAGQIQGFALQIRKP